MKKLIATGLLVAVLAFGAMFGMPAKNVSAQVLSPAAADPISSWIVLDGLFQPGFGVAGTGLANPVAANPIASWIVLDGLFQPGLVGADAGIAGINPLATNPIASWIVLDGLFQPHGAVVVDP